MKLAKFNSISVNFSLFDVSGTKYDHTFCAFMKICVVSTGIFVLPFHMACSSSTDNSNILLVPRARTNITDSDSSDDSTSATTDWFS